VPFGSVAPAKQCLCSTPVSLLQHNKQGTLSLRHTASRPIEPIAPTMSNAPGDPARLDQVSCLLCPPCHGLHEFSDIHRLTYDGSPPPMSQMALTTDIICLRAQRTHQTHSWSGPAVSKVPSRLQYRAFTQGPRHLQAGPRVRVPQQRHNPTRGRVQAILSFPGGVRQLQEMAPA
jgi:hypothetical protein